ncbi:MAG: carboxylating nicotinate-nucleotide diphosphorylase [Chloroflexota bacterium]
MNASFLIPDDRDLSALALLPNELRSRDTLRILWLALQEDLRSPADSDIPTNQLRDGDITSSATLADTTMLKGVIRTKAVGVIAGLAIAETVFHLVDPRTEFTALCQDGIRVEPGDLLIEVEGDARSLLTAERTAINFLGRTSGVATITRQYVDAISGTDATILDTRKTMPGFRLLDKYAVRMGGGTNHRAGLYDMVLIKDNHIDGAGSITEAIKQARREYGELYSIEVEVKNLEELAEALQHNPDRIMLDNMSLEEMRQAVELTAGLVPLEASGNVSLSTARDIAETGVQYISVGALTHSAPVLDISMRMDSSKR